MNENPGNGTSFSTGTLRGEPGRRDPLVGTMKDVTKKAQEQDISLHRRPVGEAGWVVPCRGNLRDST